MYKYWRWTPKWCISPLTMLCSSFIIYYVTINSIRGKKLYIYISIKKDRNNYVDYIYTR